MSGAGNHGPGRGRGWALAGFVACLALASVAAVQSAGRARTPAQSAARAAPPPPSVVTVAVEAGELIDATAYDGQLQREFEVDVPAPARVAGAAALVVTATPMVAGGPVRSGQVLVEVSGRPVIALSGAFPAYRDLTAGDTGRDVRQLQAALGSPVTGTFTARTEADVERMYRRAGYAPVMIDVPATATAPAARHVQVPAGELAFVPGLPAEIGTVRVRLGGTATGSLLSVVTGAWQVRVPLAGDRPAPAEAGVALRLGAGPFEGRPATPDGVVDVPGRDPASPPTQAAVMTIGGGAAPASAHVGDAQQVIAERAHSPAGSLIVPLSALWTAADGTVNLTLESGVQVPVTISVRANGRSAVVPVTPGALRAGDRVRVSDG
ncbi:peptidoglycan-binding domain-containing protein [Dactylosporangium sp. CA-139066]|uniref:peptidoglycan-binding domain-containing protein n=1 Tax=Dactylosporangium sp. CA-139066 TaxID=3239930 RepID=UPI003D8B3D16